MKRPILIAGCVLFAIGALCLANGVERHLAANETAEAIAMIEAGKDWDGRTTISTAQQADRMQANVSVYNEQTNARNMSGIVGFLLAGCGIAGVVIGPRLMPGQQ